MIFIKRPRRIRKLFKTKGSPKADFLFDNVGLNKVELHFIQHNIRSAKVAERIGCKIEGLLRQSYLRHGQLEDLVIAGLLRSDWMQQRTATAVNT